LDASSQTKPLIARLCAPLKLPDPSQLTRSQRLFSIATDTDVRTLVIKEPHEFFLFMNIRAERQWASFNMTPRKWVSATEHYNLRLEDLNKAANRTTIKKNPRALVEALGGVEEKVTSRLIKGDFVCTPSKSILPVSPLTRSAIATKSKTETFWRRHCFAVPLVKAGTLQAGKKVRASVTISALVSD
jgi:hypothetical protein